MLINNLYFNLLNINISHKSILHACKIEDGVLIGMGAIILNGAHIKKGATVAAGSVVTENKIIEENSLWAGVPAKYIKTYQSNKYYEHVQWAKKYTLLASSHQKKL